MAPTNVPAGYAAARIPAPDLERSYSSSKCGSSGVIAAKKTVSRNTIRQQRTRRRRTLRMLGVAVAPPCASAAPDRGVVGHELALAALAREVHHYDAAGLHAGHHAVAEGGVHDVVADGEHRAAARRVAERLGGGGRRGGPGGDAPGARRPAHADRVAVRLVGQLARDLVDEARAHAERLGPEHVAPAGVGDVEVAHRAGDADVGEPPLLLQGALVERAAVREDA